MEDLYIIINLRFPDLTKVTLRYYETNALERSRKSFTKNSQARNLWHVRGILIL